MGQGSDALGGRDDKSRPFDADAIPDTTNGMSFDDDDMKTAALRANIEQTRADMGETIEAIQGRLNPQHLKEQVKDQVREQVEEAKAQVRDATIGKAEDMVRSAGDTVNEARYTLMETIRQNPIPAAMAGIGLGWLFMNRRSTPSSLRDRYTAQRGYRGGDYYESQTGYSRYGGASSQYAWQPEYERSGPIEQGQRAVGETMHRAQETAGQVANRAQETVAEVTGRAQEAVGNVVNQAQDTAGTLAHQTQYHAQRIEDRFQHVLYETPLAAGAVALAIGVAAGLAAPQTRRENELMGEARDTLVERAQEVAQDTVEKVQRVAGEVVDEAQSTAKQAAQSQGLTQ